METGLSFSLEQAIELCLAYREKHKVRLFSQCWGCVIFSKKNPEKMCFHSALGNTGCKLMNDFYKSR